MNETRKYACFGVMLAVLLSAGGCGTPAASPAGTATPVPTLTMQPSAQPPSAAPNVAEELRRLAQAGKAAADSPFTVGRSTIADVEREWGKPSHADKAGSGMYATYESHRAAFGYNPDNGVIFDARSYGGDLEKLTQHEVTEAFGKPDTTTQSGTDRIIGYRMNERYVLKFVFPAGKDTVDHTSVFAQGSVQGAGAYSLEIVGKSNQLTSQAWSNMQAWRKKIVSFAAKHAANVFINGPDVKRVALTFDDGPDDVVTSTVVDTLVRYNVKGSFFFVGQNVKKYPDVVKKAYANGNLILSHSFKHEDLTQKTAAQIHADLSETENAIADVIGRKPAILRTPYGETDDKVVEAAKQDGYSIVLWSIDTLDWSQRERDNIAHNVVSNVRNGDIVLMHTTKDQAATAEALPIIIESLQKQGYEIVDLGTLLGIPAYQ